MSIKVMVADDEEGVRQVMAATVGGDPCYRVVVAGDGGEALETACRERPALIFLDVRMPRMSGLEVCRTLKSELATRYIKVVMVTALGTESNRQRALEAGADDYFVKPFSPTELLQKLEEVISQPQPPQGVAPAVAELPPREQEAASFEQMGQQQLIVYAQELRRLFPEERRLRSELEEKKRDLEQRVRELQGLNRLVQEHLDQDRQVFSAYRGLFLEWEGLIDEMQALAERADSLPLPEPWDDSGATAPDEGQ